MIGKARRKVTPIINKCFFTLLITLFLFEGLIINPIIVFSQTPQCPHCRATNDNNHARSCPYYGVCHQCGVYRGGHATWCPSLKAGNGQSQSSVTPDPEQQLAQGIANLLVGLIFPKKQNTSRQAEIERQNTIKIKQAEELEKQRQFQLQQEQELARQKKFDEEKDQLLGAFKDTSLPTSELKLKTGTDFFEGNAVDLRYLKGEQGIVGSLKTSEEQAEFEKSPAVWKEKQEELIQQRLEEPNEWCSGIQAHLMDNAPPLPYKTFNELQPGDVLLLEGNLISGIDSKFTSNKSGESTADHTVMFLKEVNGKKYFLENQSYFFDSGKPLSDKSRGGPRIINEEEFSEKYKGRGAEVARLVGQPLNKEEGDKLFHAAVKMAQENRQEIAKNWGGKPWLGTNYGVIGANNVVCSEADWALINTAIIDSRGGIPATSDQIKLKRGINWSPADFRNQQYFLVTPLIMPK